jgi:hypothetical protein
VSARVRVTEVGEIAHTRLLVTTSKHRGAESAREGQIE